MKDFASTQGLTEKVIQKERTNLKTYSSILNVKEKRNTRLKKAYIKALPHRKSMTPK